MPSNDPVNSHNELPPARTAGRTRRRRFQLPADAATRQSIADVAEQLMADHSNAVALPTVTSVVLASLHELEGQAPKADIPELLYRLANQRLCALGNDQTVGLSD